MPVAHKCHESTQCFIWVKWKEKSHIYQQDFTVLTNKRIVDCLLFVHFFRCCNDFSRKSWSFAFLAFSLKVHHNVFSWYCLCPWNCVSSTPFIGGFPLCCIAAFPPLDMDLALCDSLYLLNEWASPPGIVVKCHKLFRFRKLQESKELITTYLVLTHLLLKFQ